MSEKRKKEVLINALKFYLRECRRAARRQPAFAVFKREADDADELIKEIEEGWKD